MLDIHAAMTESRCAEARAMLSHARRTWDRPRLRKYYDQLEQMMQDNKL